MKKITLTIILFYVVSLTFLNAQMLKEVSLKQQIDNSTLVVEGKVIAEKSFWDAKNHNIYTSHTIKVYKTFKGKAISTIEVITAGGVVGLKAEVVTPSLRLRNNDIGVFMLYENDIELSSKSKSNNKKYKPYGSKQGFYKYYLDEDVAINPFEKKTGIASSFYNEIMSHTKSNYVKVSDFNVSNEQNKRNQQKVLLPPGSITFTPTTISAGTQAVLTINGSGFGTVQGKVGFANADDGSATFVDALDTQVLTWSDTQITVEVPSHAGTGKVRVTDDGGSFDTSAADLTVSYSELNIPSDAVSSGTFVAYMTQHVDDDNNGGYTWSMFTDFDANTAAKESFLRAFEAWRCETDVNWINGSTTSVDEVASDGINIIRFDNGTELGVTLLGKCTSRYSGCFINGGTSLEWYVSELDIVFDDGTDWNFGPGATPAILGKYDFESVALHELGHGHQLGHTVDTNNDVMHWVLQFAEDQRVLNANNITAANDVQSRSTTNSPCSESAMTNYAGMCNLSVEEDTLEEAISIYPNPVADQFFIKNASFINLEKAVIYDLSGRLINTYDISNTSRTKTIDVISMSKGIYFVNIHSEFASITKKLIVE